MNKSASILLFFASLLFCFSLDAQLNIDSLKNSLANAPEDTNKLKTLNMLAGLLAREDVDQAMVYANQELALAKKLDHKKGQANAYNRMAIIHYYKGELTDGLDCGLKALKIYEKIGAKRGVASAESLLGVIYNAKGDFKRALEHHGMALKINEELADKGGMASAYNNISLVYFYQKQHEQCLDNYNKALLLFMELKDRPSQAITLNNIANVYTRMEDYNKAGEYYSRSLAIKKELHDSYGMIESYHSMGKMHYATGNFTEARLNFLQTIKYAKAIHERSHLTEAYGFLARCDSANKDYLAAYMDMKNYASAADSLNKVENLLHMAEVQTKYETEKKELQISNQEKEIEKQTTQKTAFAIGFALMILFGIVVFRSYRLKKKANQAIMEQKQIIEQKNKEILDSIHYARRIQHSLMPTDKFIARILKKLK